MKWIVMWVAVFLASVVLFVVIPRPALLWVVNSLDVFGDGIGHVNNRTSSPVEPVSDGGDSVASHRTTGAFQADSVGRARVIAQPPALVGESESQTGEKVCRPATIRLTQPWRPANEPEYVASFGAFTPDFEVEPDEQWEQLGEHRTSSIVEVSTEVETWCNMNTCRTCVVAITARIGFAPSEIRLHERSAPGLLCAETHDAARRRTRSRHAQSSGDCGRGGETQSCVGKVPAGGAREPRKWRRSRTARGHAQGRTGPDARTAESRGLFGQGERSPGPAGAIQA